jgi:phage-related protein
MKREYIIYEGPFFTIEWYYSKGGKSQPFDYFTDLDTTNQRKFLYLIKRIGDFGKISDKTKFMNESDGIYAFKSKPGRFLSFFTTEKKIVITNAFVKKTQKLPLKEKELSIRNKIDYENRMKKGEYYE